MKVLLTGGGGFIGSHIAVELLCKGIDVVIADNYSNCNQSVIGRIGRAADFQYSEEAPKNRFGDLKAENMDCRDYASLCDLFKRHDFDGVIHLAGYKAADESTRRPIDYYENNLLSTVNVLRAMEESGVKTIVFSSSAAVYSTTYAVAVEEDMEVGSRTPYGRTKIMCEQIIRDTAAANPELRGVILRYFNPAGAHSSGFIGEEGADENLMINILRAAFEGEPMTLFGDDYETDTGSAVRDFIHVTDLARGHINALLYAMNMGKREGGSVEIFNLGTGKGTQVLELIETFSKVNDVEVLYVIGPRRQGDIAYSCADCSKAEKLLDWKCTKTLEDICEDAWKWHIIMNSHQ